MGPSAPSPTFLFSKINGIKTQDSTAKMVNTFCYFNDATTTTTTTTPYILGPPFLFSLNFWIPQWYMYQLSLIYQ
jgi:hypothetical protein